MKTEFHSSFFALILCVLPLVLVSLLLAPWDLISTDSELVRFFSLVVFTSAYCGYVWACFCFFW